MTREEAKQLWADVQARRKALDACVGPHVFVDATPEKPIGKTWRCSTCGGTVDTSERVLYDQGLAHGRAHP